MLSPLQDKHISTIFRVQNYCSYLYKQVQNTIKHNDDIDKYVNEKDKLTYLIIACKKGDVKTTKLLLKHNCNINKESLNGNNALMISILKQNIGIAKILLDTNRCKINHQNKEGLTVLHYATMHGYHEITRLLIERGANIRLTDLSGRLPIIASILNDDIINFCYLQKYYPIKYLPKLMLRTIKQNQLNMFTKLCKRKDLGFASWSKVEKVKIATHAMVHSNYAIKKLTKIGFDWNISDKSGINFLMASTQLAPTQGFEYNIEQILKYGCKINTQSHSGDTALHYAIQKTNYIATIVLLKNKNINVNIVNNNNETPLHIAIKKFNINNRHSITILRSILKRSRNYSVKDNNDKTFLDYVSNIASYGIKLSVMRQYILSLFKQCILYIENNLTKFKEHCFTHLNKDIKKKFHINLKTVFKNI